ncbi:MAG: hypothetical protein ISR65_11585 [Bacteriovoracaceae bacterium]|nr:hypothetical protein [Bacteriovoracaceae bacterium]
MEGNNNKKIHEEFRAFCHIDPIDPPNKLSGLILNKVQRDLNPPLLYTILKLVALHFLAGITSLLFCPQFEIGFFDNQRLFHFLVHSFGPYGCMIACGFFFIGSGSLLASLLLSTAEINSIKKYKYLYFPLFGAISIAIFATFGAPVYLEMAFIWWSGSVLGGLFSFKFGNLAKYLITHQ